MAETQYLIREKATGKEITCNWQNAFELVNHGFWEWAKGNGAKEFKHAQREAKGVNPDPRGFEHLKDVADSNDDDEEEYTPPAKVIAAREPVAKPTIAQIADTLIESEDGLEDMTKEELLAVADQSDIKVDRRSGTKTLISAIRAAKEGE